MALKKHKGVPERWTDYQAVGRRIAGTRFIAFKVPLKQSIRRRLSPAEAFGPLDLSRSMQEQQQELGLVIDLTYTTRYYSPQDLPGGMLYVKILTAGHEVPSDSTIMSFKRAVRKFLRDNRNNDKLIGVHCTHGLNRTGYLVCRYLIDVEGVNPAKAIDLFNSARGHCIERENYLRDLQFGPKRSNCGMDGTEQEPFRSPGSRSLAVQALGQHTDVFQHPHTYPAMPTLQAWRGHASPYPPPLPTYQFNEADPQEPWGPPGAPQTQYNRRHRRHRY